MSDALDTNELLGQYKPWRVRRGAELPFTVDVTLAPEHAIVAVVYDGETRHVLEVVPAGPANQYLVTIPHTLTSVLPAVTQWTADDIGPTGAPTPLAYGPLFIDEARVA